MASEFQRRKIAAVFAAMDVDQDGFLEEEDFESLTERWVGIRGWEPGSPGYDRMRAIMMGWWTALHEASDQDRDDKVTLDEVLLVVDQLPAMADYVLATADAMFDAIDEDGDGHVTLEEHKQVVFAWKGTDAGDEEVFALMDSNGDGYLSRAEFRAHWFEFWAGDDEDAPGQWVFGPY
jgi:Ca2+-binding EF-hand superfamily protein